MWSKILLRTAGVLAIAATVSGVGATAALAQDYLGSAVTVGGGTTGVDIGDIVVWRRESRSAAAMSATRPALA